MGDDPRYPGAKFGPKIGPSKAALFRFAFPKVLMRARRLWADLPILSMWKISRIKQVLLEATQQTILKSKIRF